MKIVYLFASGICMAAALLYAIQAAVLISARAHQELLRGSWFGPGLNSITGGEIASCLEAGLFLVLAILALFAALRK